MRIGYACLKIGVIKTPFRTCRMDHATDEVLLELIRNNLETLEQMIDYNIENDIKLFRISSDLIPFGSSPVNKLAWWTLFASQLVTIGKKMNAVGMRVSMHPGQYTTINSNRKEVVDRSYADLAYHACVLDSMKLDSKSKIVLHIGGVYESKIEAVNRFKKNFMALNDSIKSRLVIENDDKSYNISDVLEIAESLGIPAVYDNLHNMVNPSPRQMPDRFWISECAHTWKDSDGPQKIHYSQQDQQKKAGAHAESIRISEFLDFYGKIKDFNLDIMLEVKDKNLSAIKCINCTSVKKRITALETEWRRYKYKILENSQENYNAIRKLLSKKHDYEPLAFYRLIEDSLQTEADMGSCINAALHIWGYFKKNATKGEKDKFLKILDAFQKGTAPIGSVKNNLLKLSIQYNQAYLLESYYFIL